MYCTNSVDSYSNKDVESRNSRETGHAMVNVLWHHCFGLEESIKSCLHNKQARKCTSCDKMWRHLFLAHGEHSTILRTGYLETGI
jgi:hypothetical protein